MNSIDIYLIVPVHNQLDKLRQFVQCLNAQKVKPVVIWVDSSTENIVPIISEYRSGSYYVSASQDTYWARSLFIGQQRVWFLARDNDIVGIMNIDSTFLPDYFSNVKLAVPQGCLVSSVVCDTHGMVVQRGIRVEWSKIFTTKNGAIPTYHSNDFNAFSNRGIFLRVKDFKRVKFHPKLLPHYCSDHAWTYTAIKKGLIPIAPYYLLLKCDFSNTGIVEPKNIKEIFSIRYTFNPIHSTVYILMCAPVAYWIPLIIRVWVYPFIKLWRTR